MNRYARAGALRRSRTAPRRWLTAFLGLAILIAVIKTWTLVTGRTNPVDRAINTLATPLVLAVRYTADGVASMGHIFRLPTVLRENQRLRSENQLLNRQLAETELVRSTNDELRRTLGLRRSDFREVNANVVARPYDLWLDQIIIDAGREDGVRSGHLVVNPVGVVGVVDKVEPGRSWVILATSPRFRLAAITGQSQVEGVIRGIDSDNLELMGVQGKASAPDAGNMELLHVRAGSAVQVGEKVFSSGVVGIVEQGIRRPRGILIGSVIHRNSDPNGFLEVRVTPAVNPSRISTVTVMTQ